MGKVDVGCDVGVIFFSDVVTSTLSNVGDIHFDGTFYTVPSQFYQLWTIFARFGRHILPVIDCLLTAKHEELYTAVLAKIHELAPQLIPLNGMSIWEKGAKNAIKGSSRHSPSRLLLSLYTKYLEEDIITWPFQYLSY